MPTKTSPYLLIFRDASHDVYSTISAQERQVVESLRGDPGGG